MSELVKENGNEETMELKEIRDELISVVDETAIITEQMKKVSEHVNELTDKISSYNSAIKNGEKIKENDFREFGENMCKVVSYLAYSNELKDTCEKNRDRILKLVDKLKELS